MMDKVENSFANVNVPFLYIGNIILGGPSREHLQLFQHKIRKVYYECASSSPDHSRCTKAGPDTGLSKKKVYYMGLCSSRLSDHMLFLAYQC